MFIRLSNTVITRVVAIVGALLSAMTVTLLSPPSFRRRQNASAIVKAPSRCALTGGPDRKFPRLHSPLGSAASLLLNRHLAFPIMALIAALAFALLVLLPGGPLHAQNDGMIEYPENGMDAVATFTATDPEDRMVYWSLAADASAEGVDATDILDREHFMISSDGVLSFKFPPDYETPPSSNSPDNTYKVVVAASDDAPGAVGEIMVGYKKVTVMVTDMDEPGMVTLSAQQPQVNVGLTATLTDDDATTEQTTAAKWMWEQSSAANGPWTPILTATTITYSPLGVADKYLRVTATYTDKHGSDKSVPAVSANMVRAEPAAANAAPVFPTGSGARSVDENSPPGTRVGRPVTANDASGDTLTYTFSGGTNDSSYSIDAATGQITVGARTALNHEDADSHTVNVTATDPFGLSATPSGATEQVVTITINDVNEAPVVTAGATKASVMENADIETAVSTYTATDVDQTPEVTLSVSGTDAGDFEISNESGSLGQLTFKEGPNYEMPADSNRDNVYMVTVVATDAGVDSKNKMTAERAVVITVTNEDEGGTVTLTSVQPKIGFPLTASVTDLDGGVMDITWKWERDDTGTANTPITACSGNLEWEDAEGMGVKTATYTPEEDDEGKCLRATAMYTDGKGMDDAMDVSANAVVKDLANKAPEFDEDNDYSRTIAENVEPDTTTNQNPANVKDPGTTTDSPVTADDPNGDNLTYGLSGNDAGPFMIGSSDGQISAKMKLNHEAKSSYTVTVTATDSNGASDSVDVTIKVINVDEAPMIAGDHITKDYPENGRAQVARFTADDPEDRMVYWSLAADASAEGVDATDILDREHFMISSDGVLSFKFPPDYETPPSSNSPDNTYKVVVAASDDAPGAVGEIMVGYKKVTVMVTNVEETETITLSALRGQVDVALTASYNDADMEKPGTTILMWKWYLGGTETDGSTVTYTPTSAGTLRVEASYTKADGTTKKVSKTISVRAEPAAANAAPVFPTGSGARSVDENSPPGTRVGRPVTANDASGDTLTYTFSGGTNDSSYSIDAATGQITVGARTALNHEDADSHTVNVTATDPFGLSATPSGATEQVVTITINDVNEAPVVTAGATKASVMENADIETAVSTYTATDVDQTPEVTLSVSGTDAGDFEISNESGSLGQLTFKEGPNYEMPADSNRDNVYMVTVVATDAGVDSKNKMTAERAVVITVTNEDEGGTVTLTSVQPKIGFPLTASVTDLDGGVMDITWKWERDDTGTANTPITACSGNLEWEDAEGMGVKTATYTPEEDDEGKCLRATAMYTDGKGMDDAMDVSANAVVKDLANKAPEFDEDNDYSRTIAENVEPDTTTNQNPANVKDPGTTTDSPVTADDPNGDNLTYGLSGNDAGPFMIGSSDGQISAKMKLNHEAKSSYTVTVTATDSNGASDSVDVTIKVINVDEAPEIMRGGLAISGMSSVSYAENGTDAVAEYTLAGPMKDMARWALEGDDAYDFTLMNGTLKFRRSPNHEMPMDSDTDNIYMVTVKAMDGTYTATKPVTVTVTNVDEIGTLSGPETVNYMEDSTDAVGTYRVTGGSMSAMANLTLTGDDADGFRIMNDGMLKFSSPPNFETPMDMDTDNTYMVTVKAEAGGEMAMRPVIVTVTNEDDPGMVTLWAGDDPLTMPPQVGDTITGAVMDPDGNAGDTFPIAEDTAITGATWQWSRTMTPDMMESWMDITGETEAGYMVMEGDTGYYLRVMATYTDAAGTDMEYSMPTMMVGATVDEPGMVTLWASPMEELTMAPQVGDTITGLVVDPDGGITGQSWQWSRTMDTADTSSWMDIQGATEAAYMVTAGDEDYHLRVTATYTDAVGTDMDTAYSMPTMMVIAEAEDTLLGRYDTDDNGIDLDEVFKAIDDYFDYDDRITLDEVYELVDLYFES